MKKLIFCLTISFAFICFACELEGAAVIGPGGGMVFYDKGLYKDGWRYLECTFNPLKEYDNNDKPSNSEISDQITDFNTKNGKKSDWRWPTYDEAEKITKAYVTLGLQYIVNSDNKYPPGLRSKYVIRAVRQF
jgi:signal recognition particle subunit SEC65